MRANELRKLFLDFFEKRGHKIVPSASLVPRETDASVLFTTAGMHPLVPYLLGEAHPTGAKRVANVQKCVRTGDIDDVGDNRHLTFFEMLGNWSFGDYFKREAIEWSFEFLTGKEWLGLDPRRIYVTVFKGENGIPRDEEAIKIWREVFAKIGLEAQVAEEDEVIQGSVRIIPLGADDNFWIAGASGPCGGDTEMFYDTRPEEGAINGQKFGRLVENFRLIELWNDVFMEFNKKPDGRIEKLARPNVDTGMGVERTLMALNGQENVFETELFQPLFQKLRALSGSTSKLAKSERIIADHIKAATFIMGDGVTPSNVMRGYVLRRLIRRAIRHGKAIGIENNFTRAVSEVVIEMYRDFYPELAENKETIFSELEKEENQFRQTIVQGLKEFTKVAVKDISGKEAFDLYQTYGFPFEMTKELAEEKNLRVDESGFQTELQRHQELSRTAAAGAFKGGLQAQDERTTKLHTATHLLQAALREVLGPHVYQKGSNITPDRLRFDFAHQAKMTPEEIQKAENIVNEKIRANIPVICEEMSTEEARSKGALGVFEAKYGDQVKVYSIANFSQEFCGGPHVSHTGELGHFKISKEEASSAGVRRIKAVLE